MNIYTFYEPIDNESYNNYDELINIWKKSWIFYGWNPVILSLKDAQEHPKYEKLFKKAQDLPTVNPKKYEMYCYLRWAALANKGGWYADVDMINYGFTPKVIDENKVVTAGRETLHVNSFYMSKLVYEDLLDEIINYEVSDENYELIGEEKVPHVSDMYILSYSKIKVDHCYNNLIEYKKGPYKESSIVHYPTGCMYTDEKDKDKSRIDIIKEDERYLKFSDA